MTRTDGTGGDFLDLADRVDEIPWFGAVVAEAREHLLNIPEESLTAWARAWKTRQ